MRTTLLLLCTAFALHQAPATGPATRDGQPVMEYQRRLLDTAFDAVSQMPANPHAKNRARAQYEIVGADLRLGQPQLAETHLMRIDHWQRCLALLDLASFHAAHGRADLAGAPMKTALEMIAMADDREQGRVVAASPDPVLDSLRDWRLETAKARLFETQLALGQTPSLAGIADRLQPDKAAPAIVAQLLHNPGADFAATMAALARVATNQNFEVVQQAVQGYAELMDRHYADAARRSEIAESIVANLDQRVPNLVKVDVLSRAAEVAWAHADRDGALEWIDRAEALVDALGAAAPVVVPPRTRLVVLRNQAGDAAKAREELDGLLRLFDRQCARIVDIDRARLLCRLAETCALLERPADAAALYLRAVDEGLANPNGRPRADDYCTISCSLAEHRIEPDKALWTKLDHMRSVLGNPW